MIVDIERTKAYYNSLSPSSLCDCDYCKLYYAKSRAAFPELAAWLDRYGVDITKPFEASSIGPDEHDVLEYICVQYIVFGSCPVDYHRNIGGIEVRCARSYPSTGIKEEHFVLEAFSMNLLFDV